MLFATIETVSAQSEAEIAAARSLAQQYGYSQSEIDNYINNRGTNPVEQTVITGQGSSTLTQNDEPFIEVIPAVEPDLGKAPSDIFGHDFFISKGLGMIPTYNAPAPESYIIGAGDEVSIDLWGSATKSISGIVAKDGSINVSGYGPVYLAGMTVANAEKALRSRLSQVYSGLANGTTNLKLSLGRIKGVTVNVLGEVNAPGVYNMPSLSSVVSAVYMAGGITESASVRCINLYREGRLVAVFDLYKFIFNGEYDAGLRLRENDIISVSSHQNIVKINGAVVRPMKYEMLDGESVADLVKYAGGFETLAAGMVHIDRRTSDVSLAYDVLKDNLSSFSLEGGDEAYAPGTRVRYKNRLAVAGAVLHGGVYTLSDEIKSVKDLVLAAGGLTEDAYTERAYISRYDKSDKLYMVGFNLDDVMSGRQDVLLQSNDSLHIFAGVDLRPEYTVEIRGEVNVPGVFEYAEGMTLSDLIVMAGGATASAAMSAIEIASRGDDKHGKVVDLNIEANPEQADYVLQPYDMVFIRRYSYHRPQQTIEVSGEVYYPGTYVIEKSTVRLSDVINRAGGLNMDGYAGGATLTRFLSEEEYARLETAVKIANRQVGDSLSVTMDEIGDSFAIAINLEEALKHPGSTYDIVLRTGDVLNVPQYTNTVKISGAVLYPNTVTFDEKFTWRDYVSQAGGFVKGAIKRKVYTVYMNGMAASRGKHMVMKPGMEIVVPVSDPDEKKGLSVAEIAALASSTSSIAYMAALLINVLK